MIVFVFGAGWRIFGTRGRVGRRRCLCYGCVGVGDGGCGDRGTKRSCCCWWWVRGYRPLWRRRLPWRPCGFRLRSWRGMRMPVDCRRMLQSSALPSPYHPSHHHHHHLSQIHHPVHKPPLPSPSLSPFPHLAPYPARASRYPPAQRRLPNLLFPFRATRLSRLWVGGDRWRRRL